MNSDLLMEAARVEGVLAYYDGSRYYLDNGTNYIPMDRTSIKAHLERRGFDKHQSGELICQIQTTRFVRYVGPLAGRKRGVYESNGDLLLADKSPRFIESSPGMYPTIRKFIVNLLGGDEHADKQVKSFMGWMKSARTAMLAGQRRPGQALVLAGPVACGKTQLIKQVIVPGMGGRLARPYKYMSGKTNFNGDLIGSEVLVIDDEVGSIRIESRRALGDGIKTAIFASSVHVEGKFKAGFDFDPLWRAVIAVNDQPEALMILPPLRNDLSDKLMILKCQKAVELADDAFDQWRKDIADELPAFLHAVENFVIDPGDVDGRCGVKSFFHPDVVAAIAELSPERQLRQLIDQSFSAGGIHLPWEGTAALLKSILTECGSSTARDADLLLSSWIRATGTFLGRLADSGEGVERLKMLHGDNRWRITASGGEVDSK
jgi:hypothetical protein